jgi:integrating conjugative element protein (TIGR03752 family)
MKLLKGMMLLIVLALGATAYFYINDNVKDNDNPTQIDKTINKEYKTVQDDKDTVVESNKVLLFKVSSLEKHIKNIKETQNQQKIQLKSVADKEGALSTLNNKASLDTNDIVKRVVALVNKGLPKLGVKDNKEPAYKINNTGDHNNNTGNYDSTNNHNNNQTYIWTDALRSGVLDENGDYVPVASTSNAHTYSNANTYLNTNTSLNTNTYPNFADFKDRVKDNNPSNHQYTTSNHQNTATPAYTIPSNSVLSAVLTSGLVGRIPVDKQVTDPFRFNVKITDQSFYSGGHTNNVLQDVFASGTASGDLLLSCVRASIDSITFIFADGTISDHKVSDMAYLANEYGYPCIKGKLITNAAQYLGVSALFSGLSGGAKAFSEAQTTTTNNSDGSSSSSVTGSPYKFLGASILSQGTEEVQKWVNKRAQSSFDVIAIPSGKLVKILMQEQINIDYDPKGRKLNHQLAIKEQSNETLD